MAKQNKRPKRVDDHVAGACFSVGDVINQNVGAVPAELPTQSHTRWCGVTYADGTGAGAARAEGSHAEEYKKLKAGSAVLAAANAELISHNAQLCDAVIKLETELAAVRAELVKFTAPSSPAPEGNWLTRLKRIDQGRALYDRSRIIGGLHT